MDPGGAPAHRDRGPSSAGLASSWPMSRSTLWMSWTRSHVLALLPELGASRDLTVLMVSHDLGVAGALCQHSTALKAGPMVEQGDDLPRVGRPRGEPTRRSSLAAVPRLLPRRAVVPRLPSCRGCRRAEAAAVPRLPPCRGCRRAEAAAVPRLPPCRGCRRAEAPEAAAGRGPLSSTQAPDRSGPSRSGPSHGRWPGDHGPASDAEGGTVSP